MIENEMSIIDNLTPYLAMFPECRLDSKGLRLYATALNEYPAQKIRFAMHKLIKTSKFFPRVSDIIDTISDLQEHADKKQGKGTLTAGEAWEDAQREIKRRGFYSSEPWQFANKEVEAAARQFGLEELATLEMDAVNTARAQFMRMYEAIVNRQKKEAENEKIFAIMGEDTKKLIFGISEQKQIGD